MDRALCLENGNDNAKMPSDAAAFICLYCTVLQYITMILLVLYFLYVNLIWYALASLENVAAFKCQESITDKRPPTLHKHLLHLNIDN